MSPHLLLLLRGMLWALVRNWHSIYTFIPTWFKYFIFMRQQWAVITYPLSILSPSLRDLLRANRGNLIHCCPPLSVIARFAESKSWQSHALLPTSLSLFFEFVFDLYFAFIFCISALAVGGNYILSIHPLFVIASLPLSFG